MPSVKMHGGIIERHYKSAPRTKWVLGPILLLSSSLAPTIIAQKLYASFTPIISFLPHISYRSFFIPVSPCECVCEKERDKKGESDHSQYVPTVWKNCFFSRVISEKLYRPVCFGILDQYSSLSSFVIGHYLL